MNESDALELARELGRDARRRAAPNPGVGAVLLSADGVVIGSGSTETPGQRHAEIVALEQAGAAARGATLVVTLEPCSHHGRTGPCTDAIIDAGVARVIVGIEDPDPQVHGTGLSLLRDAGIDVQLLNSAAVTEDLVAYVHQRRSGRPYVVAKVAATLDGIVAMADGSSKWITSDEARRDGHELRADSQAIIVGAGTVRADDPELTARLGDAVLTPRRIVLGTAPATAKIQPCEEFSGDIRDLIEQLGREGVLQVLIEGGPQVVSQALEAGVVQRLVWYVAPAVAGFDGAKAALALLRTETVSALRRGRFVDVRRIGPDVRLDVEVPSAEHD